MTITLTDEHRETWLKIKAMDWTPPEPITGPPAFDVRQRRAQAAKERLLRAGFVLDSAEKVAMVAVLETVLANPTSPRQELADRIGCTDAQFGDTLRCMFEALGV